MTRRAQHSETRMPGRAISAVRKARSYLFYGRSGTGKTTIAATFPKPLLLLDIRDEGTDSISDVKEVDIRELESFEDFELMHYWLKDNISKYKTVVIDTASQLQQMLMKEFSIEKGKKGPVGEWGSMTRRDFGDIAGLLKTWFDNYRDLTQEGINVVFLAQDRVSNVDDEGDSEGEISPEVGPQMFPSVAKTLAAGVGFIGNTFIRSKEVVKEVRGKKVKKDEAEYCLRVGPSAWHLTKVRKPKGARPPAFITDPTYEDILAIIKGE